MNKFKNKIIIFLALFFCLNTLTDFGQNTYSFDHLSLNEGLSPVTIYSVIQDREGFIWIGTYDGLNRYDGKNFRVFKHNPDDPNSISSSIVWVLHEDRENDYIWAGSIRGGLNRYNKKDRKFIHYKTISGDKNSLGDNNIISILQDSENDLWIGTLNGLNHYQKDQEKFIRFMEGPEGSFPFAGKMVSSTIEDKKGYIWAGTDSGLNQINKKTGQSRCYKIFPDSKKFHQNYISYLYLDSRNQLWVGTDSEGLFSFDSKNHTFTPQPLKRDGFNDTVSQITGIIELSQEELWISTLGSGIFIFNKKQNTVKRIQASDKNDRLLGANFLYRMYLDRNGLLWVSSKSNGLFVHNSKKTKFTNNLIKIQAGNKSDFNNIMAICEENENIMWFATSGGLVKHNLSRDSYITYPFTPLGTDQNSSAVINRLFIDHKGVFWTAPNSTGLFIFDKTKKTFTPFKYPQSSHHQATNANVHFIFEDSKSNLWISLFENGVVKLNQNRDEGEHFLHNSSDPNTIGNNFTHNIIEDRSGYIWLATLEGGLNRYDPGTGKFKHYKNVPGDKKTINSNTVGSLFLDHKNFIWLGTARGFCKFNPSSEIFTRYDKEAGYLDNTVFEITGDNNYKIWIAGSRLTRFDPINENFIFFNNRDGLLDGEFNSNASLKSRYHKNVIYFGGTNGYNTINTSGIQRNPVPPNVVFTKINVNGKDLIPGPDSYLNTSISKTCELTLPYKSNNIILEFIALDFANPKANKYAYKLSGIQQEWIHLGNHNEVVLTNMNPGNYNLSVKGSNNDGVWNEKGANLLITILPPFWSTWWFKGILILLSMTLVFYIYRFRLRKIELKYKKMDAIKEFYIKNNISNREREIIDLIVQGKNNKEIEDILYISIKTVNNHKHNIFKKLNVNSSGDLRYLCQSIIPKNK